MSLFMTLVQCIFLQLIAERVKDKKMIVRHAALEGLSRLYQKYCAPFDRSRMSDMAMKKFGWIPSVREYA